MARPASALYQCRKFARRNKALVLSVMGGLAIAFGAMFVATLVSLNQTKIARSAEQRTLVSAERATVAAAAAAIELNDLSSARDYLDTIDDAHRAWEWQYYHSQLDNSVARIEVQDTLVSAGFGSAGDEIVTLTTAGRLQRWSSYLGTETSTLQLDTTPMHAVFDGYAGLVAAITGTPRTGVVIWDTRTGHRIGEASFGDVHTDEYLIDAIAITPDGRHVAFGGSVGLYIWRTHEETVPRKIDDRRIWNLAFSRDGKHLASATRDHEAWTGWVTIFDVGTGAQTGLAYRMNGWKPLHSGRDEYPVLAPFDGRDSIPRAQLTDSGVSQSTTNYDSEARDAP